ncbi:hypothetical protein QCA50_002298 [Cerrena zonata]|uniref:Uncharacterized protein n=1 Tax=Cerrena zonata TaxID=2478898 RepID=A0AAW0GNZ3_9APHY
MAVAGEPITEEHDEYDQFYDPIDLEDLPYIATLPPSPVRSSQPGSINPSQSRLNVNKTPIQDVPSKVTDSSDEYDEYDLSDLTTDDFANIDAAVRSAFEIVPSSSKPSNGNTEAETCLNSTGNKSGGPAIDIRMEESSTDPSGVVKKPQPLPVIDQRNPTLWKKQGPSPFEKFRSWKGFLGVTDLTGPSWCEVQFDYSLRQRRYLKLGDRPASFITADGKEIAVDKSVAAINDVVTQRGKTVHKVLEREIHPEPVTVSVTTPEERWGLRLVNMITSMQAVLFGGRCREMPVFGILNGQIITGIIDEVERKSIPSAPVSPSRSNSQRARNKRSLPGTPTKPGSPKKSRVSLSPSPSKPITTYFASTSKKLEDPNPSPSVAHFNLHISDTKTRRYNSLPPPEDTIGAHLQLMLYHRLLSRLLVPPTQSEDALDFRTLWLQIGLDHHKAFSPTFRQDLGFVGTAASDTQGCMSTVTCLDDLTKVWRNVVETLGVAGIDDTVTVVYRTQPNATRKRDAKKKKPISPEPDEEADVVRAVVESLKDGTPLNDAELAEAIDQSWKSVTDGAKVSYGVAPLEDPDVIEAEASRAYSEAANEEAELQWAIQQSLLAEVRSRPELKQRLMPDPDSPDTSPPPEKGKGKEVDVSAEDANPQPDSTDDEMDGPSTIIGTKRFRMNDKMLDAYLKSVLDWWHGRRPPKGVGIELTRRCLYVDSLRRL